MVVKPPLGCADPPDLQPVPFDGGNGKRWSWYFVLFSFLLLLLQSVIKAFAITFLLTFCFSQLL